MTTRGNILKYGNIKLSKYFHIFWMGGTVYKSFSWWQILSSLNKNMMFLQAHVH